MKPILFAVSGETPAIVTETLYELIRLYGASQAPQAIHIVTTTQGLDNLQRVVKLDAPSQCQSGGRHFTGLQGELARLYTQMGVPLGRAFDGMTVHVIGEETGSGLVDIQTETDNLAAANTLLRVTRQLTADDDSVIHFSVAGGRKTMSYYMGMCANLLGRAQDTLSHVLAAPAFEQSQLLFPPAEVTAIEAVRRDCDFRPKPEPVMSDQALSLSVVPFIRLRPFLPLPFLTDTRFDYSAVVEGMNDLMGDPHITVSLPERAIILAGGIRILLNPRGLATYWLAAACKLNAADGEPAGLHDGMDMRLVQEHFLSIYAQASGEGTRYDKLAQEIMEEDKFMAKHFDNEVAKINQALADGLGESAARKLRLETLTPRKEKIRVCGLTVPKSNISLVKD